MELRKRIAKIIYQHLNEQMLNKLVFQIKFCVKTF